MTRNAQSTSYPDAKATSSHIAEDGYLLTTTLPLPYHSPIFLSTVSSSRYAILAGSTTHPNA